MYIPASSQPLGSTPLHVAATSPARFGHEKSEKMVVTILVAAAKSGGQDLVRELLFAKETIIETQVCIRVCSYFNFHSFLSLVLHVCHAGQCKCVCIERTTLRGY